MKDLHKASKVFSEYSDLSKEDWKLFDALEHEWTEYDIMYGEESCRLEFEDGMQIALEREISTVLTFKDMTHLIYLYDAIKKLNMFFLGEWDNYNRDSGILKELDCVCKVITDGTWLKLGCEETMKCLNA